jgi:hypothetical protein
MLDVDGDGKITYDEFLSVVKEGMEVEKAAIAAGGPGAPAGEAVRASHIIPQQCCILEAKVGVVLPFSTVLTIMVWQWLCHCR